MSNRAVLYLRSSKDVSDISPDAQRRALHDLATVRNLVVVDEYLDAVESGKDEDRPAFQRLYRDLRTPARGWEYVLLLDTSRLARRRLIALIFERECDRQRVQVIYRNIPDSDPATEMLLKSVLQAFDEFHSLVSRQKGLAGMAENIRQGWRAGGRAPRGYRLEYHATGAIREGEPVLKSRLVIDTEAAPLVREYLVLRAAGLPRGAVIARLNLPWPATSTHSMDWQALTYAGHTVWNVHAAREGGRTVDGEKRRPRSEWIVQRDTHAALITEAQAEAILRQMTLATQGRRLRESPRLLSGLLRAPDGTGWHSDGCGYYRLGKGRKVSAQRVESAILDQVAADLQADEAVRTLLDAMTEPADGTSSPRQIAALERRIGTLTQQIGRTVDLASQLEEPAPVLRRVSDLEAMRAELVRQLQDKRHRLSMVRQAAAMTEADVRALLRRLCAEVLQPREGDDQVARRALADLIDRVELDPETLACRVHYALETGDSVASRMGVEPSPVLNVVAFPGRAFTLPDRRRNRPAA